MIKENIGNIYQVGTPFSNGHRSRTYKDGFLYDQHLMIDLDDVFLRPDGGIWSIIENKEQQPGQNSKIKNILTQQTSQKIALFELCQKINCNLFVFIKSEKTYYLIGDLSKEYKTYELSKFEETCKERNYSKVKTDNRIFVEYRLSGDVVTFKAVVSRNSDSKIFNLAAKIAGLIEVPHIDVDDTRPYIKFSIGTNYVGAVKSVLKPNSCHPAERIRLENQWVYLYKKMGIF